MPADASLIAELDDGIAVQLRAADPNVSAWVSANAGTGKTRVLTDRVARLLLAGTDPQRLLCLTFTRAAAAEMQERLFARLGQWATMPDDQLDRDLQSLLSRVEAGDRIAARRVFARALEIPGGLKIQTIHALCEGLLKRFPVEAGIPAHFTVADEGQAAELLAMARDGVLRGVRAGADGDALGAAVAFIAQSASEFEFRELMAELIAKRNWLRQVFVQHGGFAALRGAVRTRLGLGAESTAANVLAMGCADAALDLPALRRAAEILMRGGATDRDRGEAIHAFLHAPDRAAVFAAYRTCFITAAGGPRQSLATKQALGIDPAILPVLEAERNRVLALLDRHRCAFVGQATEAALSIGAALLEAYEAEKRRRAMLDYDDLILYTRDLLRERADAAWILSKLDSGIDHVLIDEAQDTSPEQWEVIQALSEEFFAGEGARQTFRTVFAVGDEKQSIYGFQGADPRAFGRMRRFFAERVQAARFDWRDEELTLSFRSTPEILQAVDLVFAHPDASAGLCADPRPIRHRAFRLGQAGLVEIWPTIQPDPRKPLDPWDVPRESAASDTPVALLARRIAGQIEAWLADRAMLEPRGRPIRPSDILILVRRRNAFVDAMVRMLKQKRIPVAGADRLSLTEQIAVQDLIAVGNFTLLPDDDLTLATVLRGPLVGLSEGALFELAHDRPASLWAALSDSVVPGARQAMDFLGRIMESAEAMPPFEFYTDLLSVMGGRRRMLARLGPQANDPMDEFLEAVLRFEAVEPPTLQGFLHWIEAGAPEAKRDHEYGRDEVRIMTVHGAKGLEANIVFLADTCAVPSSRHDPRLLATGPDGAFPLWPIRTAYDTAECRLARDASRAEREEEHRRLLYVAMTRARDRLYVCGYEGARTRPGHCWYDLIRRGLDGACRPVALPFGETGWRISGRQTEPPRDSAEPIAPPGASKPLPDWACRPAPLCVRTD